MLMDIYQAAIEHRRGWREECRAGEARSVVRLPDRRGERRGVPRPDRFWLGDGELALLRLRQPHSLVVADGDPEFRQALLDATCWSPTGRHPARFADSEREDREVVTGSDIFSGSAAPRPAGERRYSYFFLGASEETLAEISARLSGLSGHPPCRRLLPAVQDEFSDEDTRRMVEAVNAARTDVLWVGMTAPKQEKWIHENRELLDVTFIGAVGAVFDFYAGNVKRSIPCSGNSGWSGCPVVSRTTAALAAEFRVEPGVPGPGDPRELDRGGDANNFLVIVSKIG